jgi:hypothetical protein
MRFTSNISIFVVILLTGFPGSARSEDSNDQVKETAFDAAHGVNITVRMEGPYTAEVPLQIVCYFKYTPDGAKRMSGAPVELDKRFGGAIGSLRQRGEFVGDQLETLLIIPPKGTIEAKALLLVGLGDESALSLKLMEAVGKVSVREAARLGISRVAFAPLIRDQGNNKFSTGDVETAVVRGMLLAYDTEKRLQQEGLTKEFSLEQWNVEAGPTYFDETVKGVKEAIDQAQTETAKRSSSPYAATK